MDGLLLVDEVEASLGDDGLEFGDAGNMPVDDGLVHEGPECLSGLQLGTVRWQIDEPQSVWHGEVGKCVPASIVEQQDDAFVGAGSDIIGEGEKKLFEEGFGNAVGQIPFRVPSGWRHEGDDIKPLEAVVTERDRSLSCRSPGAPHHGLQADAMFVCGVDLERNLIIKKKFFGESVGELFLKAAASSSEADFGFFGRGRCNDQPIACKASHPRWTDTVSTPSCSAR